MCAFFVLGLYTGCRPSEAIRIKWADIEGDMLTIQRAEVTGLDGTRVVASTKTGRVRRIALGDAELGALAAHRRAQAARRLRLGSTYQDEGYVFTNDAGSPLDLSAIVHRHFYPILAAAKLPRLSLYALRHSCGSIMADDGVDPKVIQERLGHARIQTTYDNYIHTRPAQHREAAARLNRLVGDAGAA